MNKVITSITLPLICFLMSAQMFAQTCCAPGTTAPEVTTGFYTVSQIASNTNTPLPTLTITASADLPNVEYIVTKRNTVAVDGMGAPDTTGGGGDVVLGADVDGIFMPQNMTRYGITLVTGDTFDITAIGYNLPVLQNLADSLLNGENVNGQPCCNLFGLLSAMLGQPALAGFCDSLNNAGIYSAADINGMNEVLEIFDVFSDGSISIGNITSVLNIVNQNGAFIMPDCGGTGANNFLSYGVNRMAKYGYEIGNVIAVRTLSAVSSFMVFPNPAQTDQINVHFTTRKAVDLNISLIDAMGRTVYQAAANNVLGNINTTIPVHNLAAGVYLVELTDGHRYQTQKLMVQ